MDLASYRSHRGGSRKRPEGVESHCASRLLHVCGSRYQRPLCVRLTANPVSSGLRAFKVWQRALGL